MYGLELVEKSDGRVKRGTVYVLLGRLEEKGYVASKIEVSESAIPRRVYRLTALGRQVFDAWSRLAELGEVRHAFV
jgi:DNA-binding PadR family transcriptional regulator